MSVASQVNQKEVVAMGDLFKMYHQVMRRNAAKDGVNSPRIEYVPF